MLKTTRVFSFSLRVYEPGLGLIYKRVVLRGGIREGHRGRQVVFVEGCAAGRQFGWFPGRGEGLPGGWVGRIVVFSVTMKLQPSTSAGLPRTPKFPEVMPGLGALGSKYVGLYSDA